MTRAAWQFKLQYTIDLLYPASASILANVSVVFLHDASRGKYLLLRLLRLLVVFNDYHVSVITILAITQYCLLLRLLSIVYHVFVITIVAITPSTAKASETS